MDNETKFEKKVEAKVENWAEKMEKKDCKTHKKDHFSHGTAGAIYFFGFLGAAIYYIGHAESFWLGVLGFLQALVWPVFVVYHILEFLYQ